MGGSSIIPPTEDIPPGAGRSEVGWEAWWEGVVANFPLNRLFLSPLRFRSGDTSASPSHPSVAAKRKTPASPPRRNLLGGRWSIRAMLLA